MKIWLNTNWLSADAQAQIVPPPIPLNKEHEEEEHAIHIIKANMRWDLVWTTFETYKFMMAVFENGQPEELLGFLKNFRKAIDGTGTTAVAGRINYLRTILCWEALR